MLTPHIIRVLDITPTHLRRSAAARRSGAALIEGAPIDPAAAHQAAERE